MRIREMMDSAIATVSANDYAVEALRQMNLKQQPWGFVLDQNRVSGIVSQRELAQLSDTILKDHDVREYASPHFLMVGTETEPQEAERLLRQSGQRFLAVMQNNWPVGIFTLDSLTRPGQDFTPRQKPKNKTYRTGHRVDLGAKLTAEI